MYTESDLQLSLGSYSLAHICAKAQKKTTVNLLL